MPQVVTCCVGDSNVLGLLPKLGGWRIPLNNLAPNLAMVGRNCVDGVSGDTIGNHEGYGGAYVATLEGNGTIAAVTARAPALVLYSLGTNDLYYDGLGSVAATLANVLDFAEQLAAIASVRWVIAGNIPPLHTGEVPYLDSLAFRAGFEAAFASASSKISTCDPAVGMSCPSADFSDEYHYSTVGYAKVARVWYAAIRARGIPTDLAGASGRSGGSRGYS